MSYQIRHVKQPSNTGVQLWGCIVIGEGLDAVTGHKTPLVEACSIRHAKRQLAGEISRLSRMYHRALGHNVIVRAAKCQGYEGNIL